MLLILIVIGFAPLSAAAHLSTTGGPVQAPTVLVLGDSLSAGYGISTNQSWVTLLDNNLYPHFRVINASISGETSGGALIRLPQLVDQYRPLITVVELGGNDGLRGYPIDKMRKNLAQIIELSGQHGDVLLLGMQIPPNYGAKYTDLFAASYPLLAKQYRLTLVPFFLENIAANPLLMQDDGIHPRAGAQHILLENVLPYLTPLLDKSRGHQHH